MLNCCFGRQHRASSLESSRSVIVLTGCQSFPEECRQQKGNGDFQTFFFYNSAKPEWNFMGKVKGTSLASGHRCCQVSGSGCKQWRCRSISKAMHPCTHSHVLTHTQTHAGSIFSNGYRSQKTDINPQRFQKEYAWCKGRRQSS